MDVERLKALLEAVRVGKTDIAQALSELRDLPFRDLGFATVDHHRQLRTGVPEVIFGEPKTAEQIAGISEELIRTGQNVLITRLDAAKAALVEKRLGQLKYAPAARTGTLEVTPIKPRACGSVALVTAGTADVPVAEEAAETLRMMGIEVARVYDVGVAGIHRLLDRRATFEASAGVIVVAGMEGALPSVVGGLTRRPVIGVPTSIGYGAHLGGIAPMLAMLSSCAAGLTVVNIDNGFGAAMAMARILAPAE
ncbi:MAG TPA: nickel pincer cofactor biosynthesis protein LarB [Polyangiaceae bacterium]|nr:nickel pincer cofactor biosynthesis protein LarB [Polyangiaceae bacterium]